MYGPIFRDRTLSTETYFLSVFWLSHPFTVYYLTHTGRGGIEMPTRVTYVITRAIRLCHPRFSLLFTPCSVSPPIELFSQGPQLLIRITSINTFSILSSQWMVCMNLFFRRQI